ncbi:MAG TPA: 3-methyladenine DNA glycosylase [Bacteroidota bacterium]|nr:3-methyladenine DNA glycosylase [Bacteroidota bacterium]
MKMHFSVPPRFQFLPTVYSHGWCTLPPFRIDKERGALGMVIHKSGGRPLRFEISQHNGDLCVDILSRRSLASWQRKLVRSTVRSCLRLDEDLSTFYEAANRIGRYRWISRIGAGRMLRSATVYEDVIKMICTTNCSWGLTQVMVRNLCEKLGMRDGDGESSFPAPEALASVSEKFLRKEVRSGYRSPYLLEFSRRIVRKEIQPELWRESSLPASELFEEVRSVKGVGPYAAGNILKLLGHYDHLGIDSWCRKRFFEIHRSQKRRNDKTIERYYEGHGRWRGLFFWLDLTKQWYQKQFPF